MGFFAKFFTTSLVCCILGGCVTDGEDDFYEIGVGETLPAFSIKMSMGETVNSRDLKNHVSVIVFSILAAQTAERITLPYSAQTDRTVYSLFASSIIPRIYIVSPSLVITHSFTDNPLASYEALMGAINFPQRRL